jgi:hypothetical protein
LDKQRGLTPAKAQEAPQVSALTKSEQGAIAASQALTNALLFTAAQFNVVRNMSDLQMAFLAEDLLSLYWDWRFDEFLFVLREGVRQNWGKTFDRLDPPTMHEWCKAYAAARVLQIENEAFQSHQAHKKAELLPQKSDLRQHPQFGADYADARAQLDELSDDNLTATLNAYRKGQAADQQFIADVAQEVVNDRRATYYLAQIAKQLPAQTKADTEAEAAAEAHRVQAAMLRGDRAGAGLPASTMPGLYDNLPEAPSLEDVL